MDDDQLLRHSRTLFLPQWEVQQQQALSQAHVVVVGLGGLGSLAALALACCGVGRLSLCDDDLVELSNLPRQWLYTEAQLGQAKALAAAERLAQHQSSGQYRGLCQRMDQAALEALLAASKVDVVLDASDNFPTRHAINRACHRHRVPLVMGAALGMSGQMAGFSGQPCYACLFPEQPQISQMSCAEQGVWPLLVNTVAIAMADLAIAAISQTPHWPHSRLWLWQHPQPPRQVSLTADPACTVCQGGAE